MVLSFTGSIRVATAGRDEVRQVLIGALGCNLAWGLVDAVMYLMTLLVARGRGLALARAVRATADAERGRRVLAEGVPEPLDRLLDEQALEGVRSKLVAAPALPDRPRLTSADLGAALGVFLIVSLCTFPVILPFLFVRPLESAMRVSNAVALVMLYAAGHVVGRYAGFGPVKTGVAMVAVGVVLVSITMALGG